MLDVGLSLRRQLLIPCKCKGDWINAGKILMAKNLIRKSNSANQGRSFTFIQMVHTHAPLPRGFFGRRTNVAGCGS